MLKIQERRADHAGMDETTTIAELLDELEAELEGARRWLDELGAPACELEPEQLLEELEAPRALGRAARSRVGATVGARAASARLASSGGA